MSCILSGICPTLSDLQKITSVMHAWQALQSFKNSSAAVSALHRQILHNAAQHDTTGHRLRKLSFQLCSSVVAHSQAYLPLCSPFVAKRPSQSALYTYEAHSGWTAQSIPASGRAQTSAMLTLSGLGTLASCKTHQQTTFSASFVTDNQHIRNDAGLPVYMRGMTCRRWSVEPPTCKTRSH
jgi:hypothetical protein